MSDAGAAGTSLFSPRVVATMVALGTLSFIAFLWLTAYSPDLRSGRDGGAHALSNAAVGFKGLGDLLEDVDGRATRVRASSSLRETGLVVLTPTRMTDPKLLAKIVNQRSYGRTLIILPKWRTAQLKTGRKGWVSSYGAAGAQSAAHVLSELIDVTATNAGPEARRGMTRTAIVDPSPAPAEAQTIAGQGVEPLVIARDGGILVGRIRTDLTSVYVAADPDLLNNMGLRDPATARAAIGLMDHITEAADRKVTFDLTLNGFEQSSNLLKLGFEPPFLAATLCLLVAAALAALGAFFPFGPAMREARALSFGKRALVDNSADLLVGAGRLRLVADRYAALTRDAAAARLGLAPGMAAADVAAHLDRLGTSGGKPLSALVGEAEQAGTRSAVAAAAAALHRWKKDVLA